MWLNLGEGHSGCCQECVGRRGRERLSAQAVGAQLRGALRDMSAGREGLYQLLQHDRVVLWVEGSGRGPSAGDNVQGGEVAGWGGCLAEDVQDRRHDSVFLFVMGMGKGGADPRLDNRP